VIALLAYGLLSGAVVKCNLSVMVRAHNYLLLDRLVRGVDLKADGSCADSAAV
jgi:hypothetical protein